MCALIRVKLDEKWREKKFGEPPLAPWVEFFKFSTILKDPYMTNRHLGSLRIRMAQNQNRVLNDESLFRVSSEYFLLTKPQFKGTQSRVLKN